MATNSEAGTGGSSSGSSGESYNLDPMLDDYATGGAVGHEAIRFAGYDGVAGAATEFLKQNPQYTKEELEEELSEEDFLKAEGSFYEADGPLGNEAQQEFEKFISDVVDEGLAEIERRNS
ncbi:MAG: hypothetical protein BZ138_07940 [Methanosphaera sp. rholeuAM270]|nr:MAG: hypothetical protein BZ138_07940 [Methanosphaera sp. rholeuAM270]